MQLDLRNLIFVVAILGVVFVSGCVSSEVDMGTQNTEENKSNEKPIIPEPTDFNDVIQSTTAPPGSDTCVGSRVTFDYPPVNLDKTAVVVPLGLMTGNHVTPIDHQYFQNFDNDIANIEVYSPGSGYITDIQHMSGSYFDSGKKQQIEWE